MKRASKFGFVLAIIGLIAGVPIGLYSYVAIGLLLGLSGSNILVYSIYLFYIAAVVAIVGIILYFKNAKNGGIALLISAILYFIPFVCGFIVSTINGGNIFELLWAMILGNIPTIFLLTSGILGLKSKPKEANKDYQ